MIEVGKGAKRAVKTVVMSRYANREIEPWRTGIAGRNFYFIIRPTSFVQHHCSFTIHPSSFILSPMLASTLSIDPLSNKRFDFQFVNPPYGYECSKDYDAVTTR